MREWRRFLLYGILGVLVAGAGGVGLFLAVREPPERSGLSSEYTDRELLIPRGAEYRLPSVEDDLLMPDFRAFIDPDAPLDADLLDGLEPDLPGALREQFTDEVEAELEALLFER